VLSTRQKQQDLSKLQVSQHQHIATSVPALCCNVLLCSAEHVAVQEALVRGDSVDQIVQAIEAVPAKQ
jgi:hypothetical protein